MINIDRLRSIVVRHRRNGDIAVPCRRVENRRIEHPIGTWSTSLP
jgi:hypothetical protein